MESFNYFDINGDCLKANDLVIDYSKREYKITLDTATSKYMLTPRWAGITIALFPKRIIDMKIKRIKQWRKVFTGTMKYSLTNEKRILKKLNIKFTQKDLSNTRHYMNTSQDLSIN